MGYYEDMLFMQSAQRPGLFSTSMPPNYNPLGGNFMGDNPALGMMFAMGMNSMFGGQGFIPGQFLPTQNLADQMRGQQFMYGNMTAMRQAAVYDQPRMEETMRGAARMLGVQYGPEQMRAGANLARDFSQIMPFIAPFAPMTADAMYGPQGSHTMATNIMYQRSPHEVDPVTGLYGMTADTVGQRVHSMYDQLYKTGEPGAGLTAMRGMGIGAATSMFTEMRRLGMGGQSIGSMSPEDQARMLGEIPGSPLRNVSDTLGIPTSMLGGFTSSPAMDKTKRDTDSGQASEAVKKMAGAVSAIKDLFGEHGRSDAPMQELFQKLNDLTTGGLAMQSPERLENTVRQTQALLRVGGISLDAYSNLVARGSYVAGNMGIDPSMAPELAMHAATMGTAFGNVSGMSAPAWGRMNKEQLTMKDMQLTGAAIASEPANQLAAMIRYQQEVGGLKGEDLKMVQAAMAGDTDYFAKHPDLAINQGLQRRFEAAAGGATAGRFFRQTGANDEYKAKFRTGNIVRDYFQGAEVGQGAANSYYSVLMQHGLGEEAAAKFGNLMGSTLMDMNLNASADPGERNKQMKQALANSPLAGRKDLAAIISEGYGEFDLYAHTELNQTGQGALQSWSKEAVRQRQRIERQTTNEAALSKMMSPLARAGPIQRLADIIRGPGESMIDNIAHLVGATGANLTDDMKKMMTGEEGGLRAIDRLRGEGTGFESARLAFSAEGMKAVEAAHRDAMAKGRPQAELDAILQQGNAIQTTENAAGSLASLRAQFGLTTEAKFGDVLAMSEEQAEKTLGPGGKNAQARLRALTQAAGDKQHKGMGHAAIAEAAGLATKSQVSLDDLTAVHSQFTKANLVRFQGRIDPKTGGWSLEDKARTGRLGAAAVGEMGRMFGLGLADENTLKSFGVGVDDVAQGRKGQLELEAMASENNMSLQELMSYSEHDNSPLAQKVRSIFGGMTATSLEIEEKMKDKAPKHLSREDKKKLQALQDKMKRDPTDVATKSLDKLLATTGMGSMSESARKEIIEKFSKSGNIELMEMEFERGGAALNVLNDPNASAEDKAQAAKIAGKLGVYGNVTRDSAEGMNARTAGAAVTGFLSDKTKHETEDAEKKKEVVIKFAPGSTVKLEGTTLSMAGASGTATGSVPTAP